MKKILFIIVFILSSLNINAQFKKEELPKFYIENGDTIGIILTIEQVQKLDNNSDLLTLFKKMSIDCDVVNNDYVVVVNKLNEKIALLEIKIDNLNKQIDKQDDMIVNLNKQISDYKINEDLSNKQLENDKTIIKDLKKDLRTQKIKTAVAFIGAGITTITTIFLLVTH